jgi:hypothetical protein
MRRRWRLASHEVTTGPADSTTDVVVDGRVLDNLTELRQDQWSPPDVGWRRR